MRDDPCLWFGLGGFLVGVFGVAALLFGTFPLGTVNLIFFTSLLFLGALYRPNWCFLLLAAVIPFETISLVPSDFGFSLRPYQWVFLLLATALLVRMMSRRTAWPLIQPTRLDFWLALIPIGAIISGLISGGEGVRLAFVVASFYGLYLLGRVFLKTPGDVRIAFITLISSSVVSLVFGIIQNIAFERGTLLQTVMPGRPNGTFAEPDWLGFFSAMLLIFIFTSLYRVPKETATDNIPLLRIFWHSAVLIPVLITLILTVSRSAWLSAFVALVVWTGAALFSEGKGALGRILQSAQILVIACVVSLLIVVDVPLTRFELLNRAESTATGLQEITVACDAPTNLPREIGGLDDLQPFGCRHIDLEERAVLATAGFSIQTTRRPDPNVVIRSEIYRSTWAEIRTHPIFGIGWGNIGIVLGVDENGAAYNASNVWLEVLLGAGLIGLIGLIGALGEIFFRSAREIFDQKSPAIREYLPLVLSALSVFLVFNLFNAGLLIGFVWICLAAAPVLLSMKTVNKL